MTSPGGDFNVTVASGDDLPVFAARCPITGFPVQVGGRWGAMILLCLRARPRRFGVLRRHLPPVSAKVLAETLQSMERDGFVCRRPAAGARDRAVEYELSELGRSLLPVIDQARQWGLAHLDELDEHRDNHDRAREAVEPALDPAVTTTPGEQPVGQTALPKQLRSELANIDFPGSRSAAARHEQVRSEVAYKTSRDPLTKFSKPCGVLGLASGPLVVTHGYRVISTAHNVLRVSRHAVVRFRTRCSRGRRHCHPLRSGRFTHIRTGSHI